MSFAFLFDLDGTVSKEETLPILAKELGVFLEIDQLTKATIAGNIPFMESFIKRVRILGDLEVSKVTEIFSFIDLDQEIVHFIGEHAEQCAIVTGNLDCWVSEVCIGIGAPWFSSSAMVKENRVDKIIKILKKEEIVEKKQLEGQKVVFIGDGNNDAEAMRLSDIAIAYGGVHQPARSVLSVADYVIYEGRALCQFLKQLL